MSLRATTRPNGRRSARAQAREQIGQRDVGERAETDGDQIAARTFLAFGGRWTGTNQPRGYK
jgi:hypothetical protein